jgi:hypothetical protein
MSIRKTSVVVAALLATGGVTIGATPFGGDDEGTIPPKSANRRVTRCETRVGKAASKLYRAIIECHAGRATGMFPDTAAEDGCKDAAIARFLKTKTTGCTACTSLAGIAVVVETVLDTTNYLTYCTSDGTPFGGDDVGRIPEDGNIPPDAPNGPVTRCENAVGKAAGELAAAFGTCHAGRATGKYADDTAEDGCEAGAIATFMKSKTATCDPCTDLASVASFAESFADESTAIVYCASPSGAFLN